MVVQLVADAKLIMVYFHSLFRELRQRSPERVGLWCRIKRIGKSQPAIDAGYTILGILRWVEVDMLMPPCEDNEVCMHHELDKCNLISFASLPISM